MFIRNLLKIMFFWGSIVKSGHENQLVHSLEWEKSTLNESDATVNDLYPLNLKCNVNNDNHIYIDGEYTKIYNDMIFDLYKPSKSCIVIDAFSKELSNELICFIETILVEKFIALFKSNKEVELGSIKDNFLEKSIFNGKQFFLYFNIRNFVNLIDDIFNINESMEIIREGTLKSKIRDMCNKIVFLNVKKTYMLNVNKFYSNDFCILNEMIMNIFKTKNDVSFVAKSEYTKNNDINPEVKEIKEIFLYTDFVSLVKCNGNNNNGNNLKNDLLLNTFYPKAYKGVYQINNLDSYIKTYYDKNKVKKITQLPLNEGFCLQINQKNLPISGKVIISKGNNQSFTESV